MKKKTILILALGITAFWMLALSVGIIVYMNIREDAAGVAEETSDERASLGDEEVVSDPDGEAALSDPDGEAALSGDEKALETFGERTGTDSEDLFPTAGLEKALEEGAASNPVAALPEGISEAADHDSDSTDDAGVIISDDPVPGESVSGNDAAGEPDGAVSGNSVSGNDTSDDDEYVPDPYFDKDPIDDKVKKIYQARGWETGATLKVQENINKNDPTLYVIYTNDTHTWINNVIREKGKETRDMSFANVKTLVDQYRAEGKNVFLVDVGDEITGHKFGYADGGRHIIEIMKKTGYQLATLGNHEFDYGRSRFTSLMDQVSWPFVCSNFYNTSTGDQVLPEYMTVECNGLRVAFVGALTPVTVKSTDPEFFQDHTGENYDYQVGAGADGQELYDQVQRAVDKAREDADYVVLLSHLGIDDTAKPWRSYDLVANTNGIDVVLDGHSHHEVEKKMIKNKDGKEIPVSQTGCVFQNIGELTISREEGVNVRLIDYYEDYDEEIAGMEETWVRQVLAKKSHTRKKLVEGEKN